MKKIRFGQYGLFLALSILVLGMAACTSESDEKGLTGYWNFNEQTGENIVDLVSEEKQHVNYVFNERNQPLLYKKHSDPLWKKIGINGGSLLFDGYSTFIEKEKFDTPEDQLSIGVWVAPRAFEWGDQQLLSAFVSQGSKEKKEGFVFGMYRHGTWSLQLGLGDSLLAGNVEIWDNGHPLPKFKWSYVVATFDSTEGKATLYLNGEKVNEEVFEEYKGKPINKSDDKLSIGKHSNNFKVAGVFDANMFNGMMDELKIYDKALTKAEVKQSYEHYVQTSGNAVPHIAYDEIRIDPAIYDGDRYRPQFHAIPPGFWMNEPHAPVYYNGKYHLFYQHNPFGPFWHQIHWGHWVSDDMIRWENVKEAVSPEAGELAPDGVWTGSATLDRDGKPVLFITAGNDSEKPNQRVGLVRPVDLQDPYLVEWKSHPQPIVVQKEGQGDFGEFRDPFVWKDNEKDVWYMLVGTGTNNNNGGTASIYSSSDLENWEYHGNVFESNRDKFKFLGEHWELPLLLPVQSADGSIKKDIFIVSPHGSGADVEVYYWLGQFDEASKRFVPEHEEPRLIDYGDGFFTGPSGFVDPKTGRSILFTIAQGSRGSWEEYYAGWAHTTGLPVSLYLNDLGQLQVSPIEEVKNARRNTLLELSNVTVDETNAKLKDIKGDLLEIYLEFHNNGGNPAGIKVRQAPDDVEYTSVYYDTADNRLKVDRLNSSLDKTGLGVQQAPLSVENDTVKLKIFLDRSLLEVYGNDSVSITSRIFPTLEMATGLEIFGDSSLVVDRLTVFEMGSVYTDATVKPYYDEQ
ncbi:GH32 C-terminal domain-containing protein [Paenibacillus sp. 2TAB23]|uniref:GH32 C-terminal domain-containing protein n=1 Tax=Paenibacillus sp. 2TAB23 TaxID=3233004 RepID=UPI003F96C8C7